MSTKGIVYNIQRMSVHDGPGLRTTVFFKGCPLHCLWCSNPESQATAPQLMLFQNLCSGCGHCVQVCTHGAVIEKGGRFLRDFSRCVGCGACAEQCPTTASSMSGQAYDVDAIMKVIRKDASFFSNSGGGVTFSGGECTMQGAFLMELVEACLNEGLHTCIDTCGQTEPKLFERLLGRADLFLFDIKHMDSAQHKRLTGMGNELIQRNLGIALETFPEKTHIRIPLMPGLNDSEENIAAVAARLRCAMWMSFPATSSAAASITLLACRSRMFANMLPTNCMAFLIVLPCMGWKRKSCNRNRRVPHVDGNGRQGCS